MTRRSVIYCDNCKHELPISSPVFTIRIIPAVISQFDFCCAKCAIEWLLKYSHAEQVKE